MPAPGATASSPWRSFNLERFFDEAGRSRSRRCGADAGGGERCACRKRRWRSAHVLRSPDILGVVEVENLAILQRLAARINADAVAAGDPDPQYVAYLEEGNDIGGIDSGFLVKSSRVRRDQRRPDREGRDVRAPGRPISAVAAERPAAARASAPVRVIRSRCPNSRSPSSSITSARSAAMDGNDGAADQSQATGAGGVPRQSDSGAAVD